MNQFNLFAFVFLHIIIVQCLPLSHPFKIRSRPLSKRAFSYIANETVCLVDNVIYLDGDPIPTDDPCESCKCRPPGFSCVLRECEVRPGCKAIRSEKECCPVYQCGCEHNGRLYQDGERIYNAESPCYSCHCHGSSITCALADCRFRFDCEPRYISGECCPNYDHCDRERLNISNLNSKLDSIDELIKLNSSNESINNGLNKVTTQIPSNFIFATESIETNEAKVTTIETTDIDKDNLDKILEKNLNEDLEFKLNSSKNNYNFTDNSLILDDNYPTTISWLPIANLSAEHRELEDSAIELDLNELKIMETDLSENNFTLANLTETSLTESNSFENNTNENKYTESSLISSRQINESLKNELFDI